MKRFSKILIAILTVAIAVNTLCISSFAAASTAPGKSGSVTILLDDCYGYDGIITPSNDAMFESYSEDIVFVYETNKTDHYITVNYVLASDAQIGDSAYFTFTGNKVVSQTGDGVADNLAVTVDSEIVTVVKATTPGGGSGGSSSGSKVDYKELEHQINEAQKLNESDYTAASWDALEAALANAQSALNVKNQVTVTNAANALRAAIEGLVRLNRAELTKELADITTFLQGNDATAAKSFVEAYTNAMALINGVATQEEIDAAAQALSAAFEELKAALNKPAETIQLPGETVIVTEKVEIPGETVTVTSIVEVPGETVEVEKIVTVETIVEVPGEPTEIPVEDGMGDVWFALFLVFAATTTVLVVLLAISSARKKHNRRDTTPLVNYSIEDDDNQ